MTISSKAAMFTSCRQHAFCKGNCKCPSRSFNEINRRSQAVPAQHEYHVANESSKDQRLHSAWHIKSRLQNSPNSDASHQ